MQTKQTVPPDPDERHVALIARVSTNTQDTARQVESVRALAADHYPSLPVEEHFLEDGVSATKTSIFQRLPALIENIERGAVEVVIADEQSRLVRGKSAVEWAELFALCQQHDTRIHTRLEGIVSPDDDTAELVGFLRNWQNRGETRRTTHRIASEKQRRIRLGYWPHAHAPTGYATEEIPGSGSAKNPCKKLVPNEYASAVAAAFERFANQESDSAIRADLARALGKPTVSRGSLHAILKNPVYRGKVKYADDLHDGQHDSLVSEAVWRKVQARLAERRSQHFREPTHQPFTNVLRCGRCGRRMRFQTSAPAGYAAYTFFTCRTKGCPAIPAATFEASFAIFLAAAEGAIRELLDDPAYGVPRSSGPTLEEATEAEKGAQTRLTHLSRLFADNPDDAELAARYEQAKHERNAARSTVERIRGEARSYRDELTALRERIFAVLVSNDPGERCDRVAAAFAKLEADEPNPVLPLIAAWSAASFDARKTLVAESFQRIDVFDDHFEATFRIGVPEPVAWPFCYPTKRRRSDETIPRLEFHGFGKLLPVGFGKISGPDSVSSSGIHRTLTPKKWAARPMANVRQACKSRGAHKGDSAQSIR